MPHGVARKTPGSIVKVYTAIIICVCIVIVTYKLTSASCSNLQLLGTSLQPSSAPHKDAHTGKTNVGFPWKDASCREFHHLNTSATIWRFRHCPATSTFLISSTRVRYAAISLRLVGPKVIFTTLSRPLPGGYDHVLEYRSNYAGRHSAYIRLLIDVKSLDIANNCRTNLTHVHHSFFIHPQSVGDPTGLWEWETPLPHSNYSTYMDHDDPHPFRYNMSKEFSGLTFNYPYMRPAQMLHCVITAKFCFIGDSQMRNLYDAATTLIKGANDPTCTKKNKTCSAISELHYFALRYGPEWPGIKPDVEHAGCTHLLVNFGQWPLGWTATQPWTFQKYRDALEIMFGQLSQYPEGALVFWLSTSPLPYLPTTTACPPKEWRFPHIVRHYNRIAELMLQRFPRLVYINIFDMIFHLFDASYDSAHYQHPIQPYAIKYILTNACMSQTTVRKA